MRHAPTHGVPIYVANQQIAAGNFHEHEGKVFTARELRTVQNQAIRPHQIQGDPPRKVDLARAAHQPAVALRQSISARTSKLSPRALTSALIRCASNSRTSGQSARTLISASGNSKITLFASPTSSVKYHDARKRRKVWQHLAALRWPSQPYRLRRRVKTTRGNYDGNEHSMGRRLGTDGGSGCLRRRWGKWRSGRRVGGAGPRYARDNRSDG